MAITSWHLLSEVIFATVSEGTDSQPTTKMDFQLLHELDISTLGLLCHVITHLFEVLRVLLEVFQTSKIAGSRFRLFRVDVDRRSKRVVSVVIEDRSSRFANKSSFLGDDFLAMRALVQNLVPGMQQTGTKPEVPVVLEGEAVKDRFFTITSIKLQTVEGELCTRVLINNLERPSTHPIA